LSPTIEPAGNLAYDEWGQEETMRAKPSKPGFNEPAAPKTTPGPGRKSKQPDAAPSGKTVRVGGELLLRDLAGQAGVPLVGTRAIVGRKKIRKASGGAVLIKERDLLTLLRGEAPSRAPSARATAKAAAAAPPQSPAVISKRETELLGQINSGLPEPRARRLEALDARREEQTLTPEEHVELLDLVDESERLAVGRAEALVELARNRGTTVSALMRELGLGVARCG
jgi:hypothetical protein